ncbi:putative membrane protein [Synechococcus sp. A15-127]|nr:putative membrane protein [Synechococcus sp. A15-127]
MSICTHTAETVATATECELILNTVRALSAEVMELLIAAAVFIPFSALVMNAFAGDSEDDYDFL